MADMMTFPDTVEEFMEQYKITDTEHVYTNGTELVPIFRMRQWFNHKPERKTGKWIAHPGGKFVGFPYMHYECDQCRDFEPTETNFCPNCGADMRGAAHENQKD